ncbi:MAG: hypothetical protein SFX74_01700 [Fimbriimonadaceae bacterium]|nr:hypothetical protein [Fimbriimonadaceae bacterium]
MPLLWLGVLVTAVGLGWWIMHRVSLSRVFMGEISRDWIGLVAWTCAFITALGSLIVGRFRAEFVRFRDISIWFSSMCLVCILAMWAVEIYRPRESPGYGTPIVNIAEEAEYLRKTLPPGSKPVTIRTGLFIQSVHFVSGSDVQVTGFVWQKYPLRAPKSLARGVVFPEAEKAYEMEEVIVSKKKDYQLHVWFFSSLFRQPFFYDRYPLDRQDVWLRMWHRDFEQGALLVPDWDSYPQPYRIAELPGLDREFVREGFDLEYTVFSYKGINYASSFGSGLYRSGSPFPELYFNVGMRRNMLGPLVSRIVPICVVLVLLYAALILTKRQESTLQLVGFNTFTVLAYCAALFFVVVVDHSSMRQTLAPESLIYLDSFYFMLYLMLTLVSFNSILLTSDREFWIIEHEDNAIPNYLFWPISVGFILVSTLVTFGR